MTTGPVIVFGAGAGLGAAILRRFRAAGRPCVAIARDQARLDAAFADMPDVARNGLPDRMAPGRERK